jgi:hypothetical protein
METDTPSWPQVLLRGKDSGKNVKGRERKRGKRESEPESQREKENLMDCDCRVIEWASPPIGPSVYFFFKKNYATLRSHFFSGL